MHKNKTKISDKQLNTTVIKYILLFILNYQNIYSQGKWIVQNPFPTEAYLLTVEPITEEKVFIGGLGGTLLKTNNAGRTWEINKFNNLVDIRSISFRDSLNGWLIDSEHINYTTNGGESWNDIYIDVDMTTYFFLDVACFNSTIYLFLKPQTAKIWELPTAISLVYRSTDYGKTWKQLDQQFKGKMLGDFFLNENIGWILAEETISISESYIYFYKTNDGGKTWDKNLFPDYVGATPGIFFLNENLGFVEKYRTLDGGEEWENMFNNVIPQNESIDDIFFEDSLCGWAVSGTKILHSTNGGLLWNVIDPHSSHRLTDINFSENGTGWIVGWAGNIFQKDPLNNYWVSLSKGNRNSLNDVFFINEKEGWCVGTYGTILHTQNGGETWESQESKIDSVLYSIKFLNSQEGWIAGHYIVLHTKDGGKNWEIKQDLNGWFVDVDFFDDKNGLVIERFGDIYKTTNGGTDWQISNMSTLATLTSLSIVNENEAWIGGWQGMAYTSDKGETIQWYNIPDISLVKDIQFINSKVGFLCNDLGDFLHTDNNGLNWNEIPRGTGLDDMISTFFATNPDSVWLYLGLASGNLKQVTTNQILLETEIQEYWVHRINSIFFINACNGWAVGDGGVILKYSSENQPTNVNADLKNETKSAKISVFPNPFNYQGINISFYLQHVQEVNIQIYNSLGQKVQTLYNDLVSNGYKNIYWCPINISPGIYYISIKCVEFCKIIKCIFIH